MFATSFDDLIDEKYLNEVLNPEQSFTLRNLVVSKVKAQRESRKLLELPQFIEKSIGAELPSGEKYYYIDAHQNKKLSHLGLFYKYLQEYATNYNEEVFYKLILAASDVSTDLIYAEIAYNDVKSLRTELESVVSFVSGVLEIGVRETSKLLEEIGRIKLKFENYSIFRKRDEFERLEGMLKNPDSTVDSPDVKSAIERLRSYTLNKDNNELLLLLVKVCVDSYLDEND